MNLSISRSRRRCSRRRGPRVIQRSRWRQTWQMRTLRGAACFSSRILIGAVLKLHNCNTKDTAQAWTGVYTELIEISDNLFTGTSGAQLVETAPQNSVTDERLLSTLTEVRGSTHVTDQSPEEKLEALERFGTDLTAAAEQGPRSQGKR